MINLMSRPRFDFIELVYEYPFFLPLLEKEDYVRLPVSVADEMGLKTAIFTNRTKFTPRKSEVIDGFNVLRFDTFAGMLGHVVKSRTALVHGHSFGWIPASVAPLLTRNCALTPHVYKLSEYPKWKIDLAMKFSKRANAIVVLTQFEASQFRKRTQNSRVHVIPHPIDCDFFSRNKNRSVQASRKRNLDRKVILCVSNLFPTKNLETLIRGFAIVEKIFPKSKLVIVGGEPRTKLGLLAASKANWRYQNTLMDLAASLRIGNKVIFTGHKSGIDLRNYYEEADVFCLPSTKECQSLAAGEAACSGLPIVMSNLEPLTEIYRECSLFHRPTDHKALAAHVIEILQNPNLAKKLTSAGYSKMQEYHPTKIRAKLKQLYNVLLSE